MSDMQLPAPLPEVTFPVRDLTALAEALWGLPEPVQLAFGHALEVLAHPTWLVGFPEES